MSTDTKVLREYLIALGFKVDPASNKRFDASILKTNVNVQGLAKSALATATATQAMVALFARGMEKMYYSSIKANSTVGNMQAIEFGAKQIGMAGGSMQASLEGMARAIRLNPGIIGMLEGLGVQVKGRDMADVAKDVVKQLAKLPFYVSAQYANLLGISPDDLLLLEKGIKELEQFEQARKDMAREAGVDSEAAAKAGKEYMQLLRSLEMQLGLLKDAASLALLPAFKTLGAVTSEVLRDWIRIVKEMGNSAPSSHGWWDPILRIFEYIGGRAGGARVADVMTPETKRRLAPPAPSRSASGLVGSDGGATLGLGGGKGGSFSFDALEARYGLPKGLLDRMWKQESNRGDPKYMLSPAGAKGHFGFMDPTAKQYGVDANDLKSSAQGAAKYMADLLKKYDGDLALALAGYNWGMGNVDRKGLGAAPLETRKYIKDVGGITLQTNVTVNGAADPKATGTAVERAVVNAHSTVLRNHGVRIQ